jgi:TonB family protein
VQIDVRVGLNRVLRGCRAVRLSCAIAVVAACGAPSTTLGAAPDAEKFEEEPPPIDRGQLLTEAQLRYCLAESVRIDAVRSVLDKSEPGSVEEFNQRIADFNGRCGSYRYAPDAMFYAQRDVDDLRPQLEAEARDAYRARAQARKAQRAEAGAAASSQPRAQSVESEAPRPPPGGHAPDTVPHAGPQTQPSAPAVQPSAPAAQQARSEPAPTSPPAVDSASQARAQPSATLSAQAAPRAGTQEPQPAVSGTAVREVAEQELPSPDPMTELRRRGVLPGTSAASPAPGAQPPVPALEPHAAMPAAPEAPSPTTDPALARYIREIQKTGTRVLDETQYLSVASGKGWKATVQIDVHFARGGFIRSILLGESCGHAALDARALELARGLIFPRRPEALYPREFTVRFPITFKPRSAR